MEQFNVGDRVAVVLDGKLRYQKIRSFVPDLGGGYFSDYYC